MRGAGLVKPFVKSIASARQQMVLRNLWASFHRRNLDRLAAIYGTDKCGKHSYTPHYQKHFWPLRKRKLKLLEIGVGGYDDPHDGGESLRMWKKFFPRASIFAIDIHDKSALQEKRITIFQGSQADEAFLRQVMARIGQLDIIIDDGSHVNEHVRTSFRVLFPHLKDGGIYVVEDTQTAYWANMGGCSDDLNRPDTTMAMLKALVDGLNHEEFTIPDYTPSYFDRHITGLHFYHNLVFIYKGLNNEGGSRNKPLMEERRKAKWAAD